MPLHSRQDTAPIPDRKETENEVMKGFRNAGLNAGNDGTGLNSRDLPVSSRREAMETLRRTLGQGDPSVVLLTGEPGTGKTWLWRQLVRDLPANWRWLAVDMSESLDPLEFLRLISHGLGIRSDDRLGAARLEVARVLEEDSTDGKHWLLVVENAHCISEQVWTEILAILHAMEESAGFAAILLVGSNKLTNQLSTRSLSFMATRISTHVHLLALDLDESLELVQAAATLSALTRATLEELHRDRPGQPAAAAPALEKGAGGGSRRFDRRPVWHAIKNVQNRIRRNNLRIPNRSRARWRQRHIPHPSNLASRAPASDETADGPEAPASSLVPSRPPLRVEEGLIEVGWEGTLELESEAVEPADVPSAPPVTAQTPAGSASPTDAKAVEDQENELLTEEMIEDHYAALQAWTEWAKNRGRVPSPSAESAASSLPEPKTQRPSRAKPRTSGRSRVFPRLRGSGPNLDMTTHLTVRCFLSCGNRGSRRVRRVAEAADFATELFRTVVLCGQRASDRKISTPSRQNRPRSPDCVDFHFRHVDPHRIVNHERTFRPRGNPSGID